MILMKGAKGMNRQVHANTKVGSKERQVTCAASSGVTHTDRDSRSSESLDYYAQLMRHDWHSKVRHRIRQRGWGK
jgi:hypothetical protein